MSTETIGYSPREISKMPETRQKYIEAKFIPQLNLPDSILLQASDTQLEFIASVLS